MGLSFKPREAGTNIFETIKHEKGSIKVYSMSTVKWGENRSLKSFLKRT